MIRGTLLRAALPTALLAGFVGGPARSQPEPAAPTATFIFHKAYDRGIGLGQATFQAYFHLPAGTCRGKRRMASFTFIDGEQRQRPMQAGRPLTLWMVTEHNTPNMESRCHGTVTFTPRPGATYDIAFRSYVGSHCRASVVDSATGRAPDDLIHDNSIDCR